MTEHKRGPGASAALNLLAPIAVYQLLKSRVGGDGIALALAAAVPASWTLLRLSLGRRVDPAALFALFGFGVGALVLLLRAAERGYASRWTLVDITCIIERAG